MRFRIYGAQLNVGFFAADYAPTDNPQVIASLTPLPEPQATVTWGRSDATEVEDPGWTATGAVLSAGDELTVSAVPPRTFTLTLLWRLDRYPVTGSAWPLNLGGFGLEVTAQGRLAWTGAGGRQEAPEPLPLGRWLPMSVIADGVNVTVSIDNVTVARFGQGPQTPTQAVLGGGEGGFRVAHAALYGVAVSLGATLHLYQYLLEVGRRLNIPVSLVSPEDPALYPIPGTDNFRTGSELFDTVFTRPSPAWR